ncbi:MAG: prenyltransferase [Gemmataceae bacterium]
MSKSVGPWGSVLGALLIVSVAWNGDAWAQNRRPVTADEVRDAIAKGVQFLRESNRNGTWEHLRPMVFNERYQGGLTAVATLALLECGYTAEDDLVRRALAFLRTLPPEHTYVVSLQTMALAHPNATPERDRALIARNMRWLVKTMRYDNLGGKPQFMGWGYPDLQVVRSDNSNSQYAVLALHAASQVGVDPGEKIWRDILSYYRMSQLPTGGWNYTVTGLGVGLGQDERLTMTVAGFCSLLIADMHLSRTHETIHPDGRIEGCGRYRSDPHLEKALARVGETFAVDTRKYTYYNLYGIERAGRLSGQRFFYRRGEPIDWYREGARFIVDSQRPDGSWQSFTGIDGMAVVDTAFALLFLAKGKMPVLVNKLMHGDLRARYPTGDWNNDRNDVRHLTEFCSQMLFMKNGRPVPLTWQTFDASKLTPGDPQGVAELLQAPIAFFNGHSAPYFTDSEKQILKQFVEQGGFIFVEACCSSKEFDAGVRELIRELWPDRSLEPLPPGHAIWTAFFQVPPGSFGLEGIDLGCKTVLVYAPQDMSCYWESGRTKEQEQDRAVLAFRLGANVVAYATGLEPPEDKLTPKQIASQDMDPIRRNSLQVAQINYGGRDWQPAPRAMRTLMEYVRSHYNVDVVLQTQPISLGDPALPNYKFLYMHGRRKFSLPPADLQTLRRHLELGGFLLADACCGSEEFDRAFRDMIQNAFGRPLEPIPLTDPFFTDRFGKELKEVQCRTQRGHPYTSMAPQLEGVRLDPNNPKSPWIVVYSKYDLGCALDRHQSPDCLGHSHRSALDIASQAVLYALKE